MMATAGDHWATIQPPQSVPKSQAPRLALLRSPLAVDEDTSKRHEQVGDQRAGQGQGHLLGRACLMQHEETQGKAG
jgi:hypothetical protein